MKEKIETQESKVNTKQLSFSSFKQIESDTMPTNNASYSITRGRTSELIFALVCLSKKWQVSQSLVPGQTYDFVIRLNNGWKTVQVKTVYIKQHNPHNGYVSVQRAETRRTGKKKRYIEGDFDYLAAVNIEKNKIWLIPWDTIKTVKHRFKVEGPKYDVYLLNQENSNDQ